MAWTEQGTLRGPKGDPGTPAPQDAVTSVAVTVIWVGTRAEYEALTTPDPATVYLIVEG